MRATFLTCMFLFVLALGYGQKPPPLYPGYVVTLDNDTIKGEIKRGYMEKTGEYTGVVFFPAGGDMRTPKGQRIARKTRFSTASLLGYEVFDRPYTRFKLKEEGFLFMQQSVKGPITLYYGETFSDQEEQPHFILVKGEKAVELDKDNLREDLRGFVSDFPDYDVLLFRAEWTLDAMRDIVTSYNDWAVQVVEPEEEEEEEEE